MKRILHIIILAIFLASCTSSCQSGFSIPFLGGGSQPTATALPNPTPIPLTQEQKDEILKCYEVMIYIDIIVDLMNQATIQISIGQVEEDDVGLVLFGIAFVAAEIDEMITERIPPDMIRPHWDTFMSIFDVFANILARWFAEDIDNNTAMREIAPYRMKSEASLEDFSNFLIKTYGFTSEELYAFEMKLRNQADEIEATEDQEPVSEPTPGQ